jgi:hypothetical protein
MAARILEFFADSDMAILQQQFEALKTRVGKVESSLSASAPHGRSFPGPIVLSVLGSAIAILAVIVPLGIHLDNKIGGLQGDYQHLSQRLDKLDSAVKAISSQQSDQTQKLVQNLLAAAKTNNDPQQSRKALMAATSLTQTLRTAKVAAPPEFFRSSVDDLNDLTPKVGAIPAFQAKLALANYRSSITTVQISGPVFQCTGEASVKPSFDGTHSVKNISLVGCVVVLDNKDLTNVTFINAHIIYRGGPLHLDHVLFVNCTFEAQPDKNASNLLEYAALDQNQLEIGKPAL